MKVLRALPVDGWNTLNRWFGEYTSPLTTLHASVGGRSVPQNFGTPRRARDHNSVDFLIHPVYHFVHRFNFRRIGGRGL